MCVCVCVCVRVPVCSGALVQLVHTAPHGTNVLVDLSYPDVPEVAGLLSSQQVIDLKDGRTEGRKTEKHKIGMTEG